MNNIDKQFEIEKIIKKIGDDMRFCFFDKETIDVFVKSKENDDECWRTYFPHKDKNKFFVSFNREHDYIVSLCILDYALHKNNIDFLYTSFTQKNGIIITDIINKEQYFLNKISFFQTIEELQEFDNIDKIVNEKTKQRITNNYNASINRIEKWISNYQRIIKKILEDKKKNNGKK